MRKLLSICAFAAIAAFFSFKPAAADMDGSGCTHTTTETGEYMISNWCGRSITIRVSRYGNALNFIQELGPNDGLVPANARPEDGLIDVDSCYTDLYLEGKCW